MQSINLTLVFCAGLRFMTKGQGFVRKTKLYFKQSLKFRGQVRKRSFASFSYPMGKPGLGKA